LVRFVPSAFITSRSTPSSLTVSNAIREPSGDHESLLAYPEPSVSGVTFVPSGSITTMSLWRPSSKLKAIFDPSGDQTGLFPDESLRLPVPSAFMM